MAKSAIRGGTCLGHAVEGQPLEVTLDVERGGLAQPVSIYFWLGSGGQILGSQNKRKFVLLPGAAPSTVTVYVSAIGRFGCRYIVQRDFQVITKQAATWEINLCALLDKLRTVATHVFRPDPLWDPLRDLATRPAARVEIESAELFSTTLIQLVKLLKTRPPDSHRDSADSSGVLASESKQRE